MQLTGVLNLGIGLTGVKEKHGAHLSYMFLAHAAILCFICFLSAAAVLHPSHHHRVRMPSSPIHAASARTSTLHLSLSQGFLVLVSKPAVSLQPISSLFPLLSPLPHYSACLQPAIILALRACLLGTLEKLPGSGMIVRRWIFVAWGWMMLPGR